ncbi:alpha-(1,3)-fucosyltransferase C-like [Penaeus monodon]|uniref:alpha-(1,3)-fucosyltransferase C-like n=1 Tax=Penaeus monodon TaxID=6687 RepID=UPI0018A73A42|nr:alpha-(1,3)-fucosyltransferase C-like [Penaeus monodon]XP_037782721.1 alpha-(1,3)-fucosyltransferase C-like [Penaeus monodon]
MRLCKISNHSIRKTLNLRAIMLAVAVLLAKFLWERPTSIGENPIHRYTNIVSDPSLLTQTWNQSLREREMKRFPDFKALNPDFKPAEGPKVILFWTEWEKKLSWEQRFGTEDELMACPSARCHSTYRKEDIYKADAVLFKSDKINPDKMPSRGRYWNQRWVWVGVEAPLSPEADRSHALLRRLGSSTFNWTMTYHPESEVLVTKGFLTSFLSTSSLLRPSLLGEHKSALVAYQEDIALNTTLIEVMGVKWRDFVTRPKLLMSWFDGSCNTSSKREEYIKKLATYIELESYGRCGRYSCRQWGFTSVRLCWKIYMATKFLFALIMEDYLCDYYVSLGLYRALEYGLVPIVWGGTAYDHILPPGSYIDARMYHPLALGNLLTTLRRDPVAYSKYHVWRRYWAVTKQSGLCELCHLLHNDTTRGHHIDIPKWRRETEQCVKAPSNMFHADNWKEVIYQ